MVNVKKATDQIAKLALMKFFPADPAARLALVGMVCGMASTDEQIEWLVRRAIVVFNEWPGPMELRALFCSRWKPRDGHEAYSVLFPATEVSPGFPRDPTLPAAAPALLTPGKTEATRLLDAARSYTPTEDLPAIRRPAPRPRMTVEPVPNPNYKPITQADIDREVEKLLNDRGREEAGL